MILLCERKSALMLTSPTTPKIQPEHLHRQAIIYVRQSTLIQVRDNTGSTARQYDLQQRAHELGWDAAAITLIDQDQGQSGASATFRDGFQRVVAEVGLGHVGAVFSLEASRLARSCSDWYRLLEICALTQTLVIDEEGIYDPSYYNDRLLLGFTGIMSEAELHWLRQRLLGGKLTKASKGQLRVRLPVGFVYDPAQHVVLDPDEAVQEAVRLVFSLFDHYGSAIAVVSHFASHHLRFPTRLWGKTHEGELVWGRLCNGRVLDILHSPVYAGAFVYGRTHTRQYPLPGETQRIKGYTRRVKMADWPIVLRDAHVGYIEWQQFLRNQRHLQDNCTVPVGEYRGAVREGTALLQGIVLCGRCGRRMTVRYIQNGEIPSYECNQAHSQLAAKTCQTMRGDRIDAAVAGQFLAAIQPAHLEVALAALDQLEARARQSERQWALQRERAQYEADLARRRFLQVDPENRLVARTLEHDWNEKLAAVAQLEREYLAAPQDAALQMTADQRHHILALAQDIPTLWHAARTTPAERKQLIRLLIKDVTLTKQGQVIELAIRWQTEARTVVLIPRTKQSWEERQTAPQAVTRIRELATDHTDAQIAKLLNEAGEVAGMGGAFTTSKVQWIRHAYAIETGCPERPSACPSGQRADGRYSAQAAADLLNVDVSTIAEWCKTGRLDSIRSKPGGPRWIALTPEVIQQLRKPTRRTWNRPA
jgi:DNA invertase Pin-like site-specific DNA recombinase